MRAKGAAAGLHAQVPRLGDPDQEGEIDTPPQAVESTPMAFCVHVIRHAHHAIPRRNTMATGRVLRKEQDLRDELLQEVDVEAVQPYVAWHRGVGEANHNAARAAARASTEQHGAEEEVAPREPEDVEPAPERRLTMRSAPW